MPYDLQTIASRIKEIAPRTVKPDRSGSGLEGNDALIHECLLLVREAIRAGALGGLEFLTVRPLFADSVNLEAFVVFGMAFNDLHKRGLPFGSEPKYIPRDLAALADLIAAGNDGSLKSTDDDKSNVGPVPPNGFCCQGTKHFGMAPKPWLLVNHLGSCDGRECDIMDLAQPVWGDDDEDVDPNGNLASVRREVNKFFRTRGLPFLVRIDSKNHVASLVESPS